MSQKKYLFRCVAKRTTSYDTEMDYGYSYISGVCFQKYEVLKETEKGFWIGRRPGWPASWIKSINSKECRFVLKGRGKRFASETKEQAFHNLRRRAFSRRKILAQQTEDNEKLLSIIESNPIEWFVQS